MCLAVPGKIVSIDESNAELKMAKVNFGGVMKDICIQWLPDVSSRRICFGTCWICFE